MSSKKYKYFPDSPTPMAFYKFLLVLIPISIAIGCFLWVMNLTSIFKTPLLLTEPSVIVPFLFSVVSLGLLILSWRGLKRMEWYGPKCYFAYVLTIIFQIVVSRILSPEINSLSFDSFAYRVAVYCVAAIFPLLGIFLPIYIYFRNRRLLFSPWPKGYAPAIPADDAHVQATPAEPVEAPSPSILADDPIGAKPMNEFNTPENYNISTSNDHKPKNHARYKTYILCPDCGAMVPKGIKLCGCGYDFRNPFWKAAKKILRYAVPALLCVCCAVGGYCYGRESMAPELELQYKEGYDSGYYEGHKKGRAAGIKFASNNYASAFKDGYHSGVSDKKSEKYSISSNPILRAYRFEFSGRDQLHMELAQKYGFYISDLDLKFAQSKNK